MDAGWAAAAGMLEAGRRGRHCALGHSCLGEGSEGSRQPWAEHLCMQGRLISAAYL